jgi:hypothetical protein
MSGDQHSAQGEDMGRNVVESEPWRRFLSRNCRHRERLAKVRQRNARFRQMRQRYKNNLADMRSGESVFRDQNRSSH